MKKVIAFCLPLAVAVLAGCGGQAPAVEPTAEPAAPEPTPEPTAVPPTPVPPTMTPEPGPAFAIEDGQTADDGCTVVTIDTASWGPIDSAYIKEEYAPGETYEFFLFRDNEDGFDFAVELYPRYGMGWTGQSGTFPPDCHNVYGICVNLALDDENRYQADQGEVDIITVANVDGTVSGEIVMTNLTLQPFPGTDATGCYHIDEVSIFVEE